EMQEAVGAVGRGREARVERGPDGAHEEPPWGYGMADQPAGEQRLHVRHHPGSRPVEDQVLVTRVDLEEEDVRRRGHVTLLTRRGGACRTGNASPGDRAPSGGGAARPATSARATGRSPRRRGAPRRTSGASAGARREAPAGGAAS